jgi:hypothetical protein
MVIGQDGDLLQLVNGQPALNECFATQFQDLPSGYLYMISDWFSLDP